MLEHEIAEAHRRVIRADLSNNKLILPTALRARAERALADARAGRGELSVIAHECALSRTATTAAARRKSASPASHGGRLAAALETLSANVQAFGGGIKAWQDKIGRVVALLERHQAERDALESPTDEGALKLYEAQAKESVALRRELGL